MNQALANKQGRLSRIETQEALTEVCDRYGLTHSAPIVETVGNGWSCALWLPEGTYARSPLLMLEFSSYAMLDKAAVDLVLRGEEPLLCIPDKYEWFQMGVGALHPTDAWSKKALDVLLAHELLPQVYIYQHGHLCHCYGWPRSPAERTRLIEQASTIEGLCGGVL